MPLFFLFPGFKMVPSFWRLLWGIGKYHSRNQSLFPYGIRMIIGRQAHTDAPATTGGQEGFLPGRVHENMVNLVVCCFLQQRGIKQLPQLSESGASNSAVSSFLTANIYLFHIFTFSTTCADSLTRLIFPLFYEMFSCSVLCTFPPAPHTGQQISRASALNNP